MIATGFFLEALDRHVYFASLATFIYKRQVTELAETIPFF